MSDTPQSPSNEPEKLLSDPPPDIMAMITADERERAVIAAGGSLEDFWSNIGRGQGGFYDLIRKQGCTACGCHTPGNCDACA